MMKPHLSMMQGAGRLLALGVLALLGAGCESKAPPATDVEGVMLEPAQPLADAGAVAQQWYHNWVSEPDRVEATPIRETLLNLYLPDAQGWRPPHAPPGYIVQMVLLDAASHPIQVPGAVQVVLVERPQEPEARAIMAWTLTPDEARGRYRRVLVPGYVLNLGWQNPPGYSGEFMLIVRWLGLDGQARVTRNLIFQDYLQHATTQPQPQ